MASMVVRAAAKGDREALEFFVAGTQADVYRLTEALIGSGYATTATEVVFERVWTRLREAARADHLKAWLYGIALEVCHPYLDSPWATGDQQGDIDLGVLLLGLPPSQRTAFALTPIAGLDYRHTAQVTGENVSDVRRLVASARQALLAAATVPQ